MNTGDRHSKRSCSASISLLQGRSQSAIPRRAPAPSRVSSLPTGWSLILSQPLSAASFQHPAAKAGVFAACLIGAAAIFLPPFIVIACGSVHAPLRRLHQLRACCGNLVAALWRAVLRQPSSSTPVSQEILQCIRTATFSASRHAAAARQPSTRHDVRLFPTLASRSSQRGFVPAPLPPGLPTGRRTDASFEATGDRAHPAPRPFGASRFMRRWHEH